MSVKDMFLELHSEGKYLFYLCEENTDGGSKVRSVIVSQQTSLKIIKSVN